MPDWSFVPERLRTIASTHEPAFRSLLLVAVGLIFLWGRIPVGAMFFGGFGGALLVGAAVDAWLGTADSSGSLARPGSGVAMILIGVVTIAMLVYVDATSPIAHPLEPAMGGAMDSDNPPAVFLWALPVVFGLWGVTKLAGLTPDIAGVFER